MKHFFTLYLLQDGDSSSDYVSGDSVQLADTPAETAETKSADKPKVTYSLSLSLFLYLSHLQSTLPSLRSRWWVLLAPSFSLFLLYVLLSLSSLFLSLSLSLSLFLTHTMK